jgi:2-polyprenyl-6-methoxyphenol hydroxylase-like FAD-dependent oxidoreductase
VRVRVRDRSTGRVSALRADVLVGADGPYSGVRAQLHPGEPPPRWGGIMMWRGITEGSPFLTGRTVAVAGTNAGRKFVAYPISAQAQRRGRALLNWVAEVRLPTAAAAAGVADWNGGGGAVAFDQAAYLDHGNPPVVWRADAESRARPPWRARLSACAVHATDRAVGRERSQHPSWGWGFPPPGQGDPPFALYRAG